MSVAFWQCLCALLSCVDAMSSSDTYIYHIFSLLCSPGTYIPFAVIYCGTGDHLLPLNRHCWGTCCCVPGYCMHAHNISLYTTNGISLCASPVLNLGPLYLFFHSLGQAYFFFGALQCLLSYGGWLLCFCNAYMLLSIYSMMPL